MIATAYWSLWVRVPAYIVGSVVILCLGIYWILKSDKNKNRKQAVIYFLLCCGAGFILFPAYILAWNEKQVVAAFAELTVAFIFRSFPIVGFIVGVIVGNKVYTKSDKKWLGWAIGIIVGLLLGIGGLLLGELIPGVGWRIREEAVYNGGVDFY